MNKKLFTAGSLAVVFMMMAGAAGAADFTEDPDYGWPMPNKNTPQYHDHFLQFAFTGDYAIGRLGYRDKSISPKTQFNGFMFAASAEGRICGTEAGILDPRPGAEEMSSLEVYELLQVVTHVPERREGETYQLSTHEYFCADAGDYVSTFDPQQILYNESMAAIEEAGGGNAVSTDTLDRLITRYKYAVYGSIILDKLTSYDVTQEAGLYEFLMEDIAVEYPILYTYKRDGISRMSEIFKAHP